MKIGVLAVQGEDDPYGTMAQIEAIARRVPQSRLLKLAACGHSPQRDRPEALVEAVDSFLQACADFATAVSRKRNR